jgi:hypothetical protein
MLDNYGKKRKDVALDEIETTVPANKVRQSHWFPTGKLQKYL